jgi:hypothetical protein
MKKTMSLLLILLALTMTVPAFAETTTYSTQQEQGIRSQHSNVPSTPIWKNKEFWKSEKERSGLPGSMARR